MSETQLSIVLPVYNEARCIEATLDAVARELDARSPSWEILVVDDGSTDATSELARARSEAEPRIRRIGGPRNRGKGYAVRRGMLEARGSRLGFMDADLSTPAEEIDRAVSLLERGADVVIGTRCHPQSRVLVRQARWRATMGDVFRRLSIGVLRLPVSDVTCGFKFFTRAAARAVFERARLDDWSFDAEILYAAKRLGLRIVELPVTWSNDPATRVRAGRDALRAARGVAGIMVRGWRGEYDAAGRGEQDGAPCER